MLNLYDSDSIVIFWHTISRSLTFNLQGGGGGGGGGGGAIELRVHHIVGHVWSM